MMKWVRTKPSVGAGNSAMSDTPPFHQQRHACRAEEDDSGDRPAGRAVAVDQKADVDDDRESHQGEGDVDARAPGHTTHPTYTDAHREKPSSGFLYRGTTTRSPRDH